PGSSGGLAPGRLHHLPRRDLADPAQLGRELLPQRQLLQRGRPGRPLRRVGGAGALLRRGAGRLQLTALMTRGRGRWPRCSVRPRNCPSRGVSRPWRARLPSLARATPWPNSPPLDPEGLRGKVVVVDFCTYTCINWLRTLPYVRAWAGKYRDLGLVVIGAHTPEFSFESDLDNVRQALLAMAVEYPVAVDNGYAIWDAFANHYWPALYFIDATGRIRHHWFGEGDYERSETVIQQLLAAAGAGDAVDDKLVAVDPLGPEVEADWVNLRSPETYLGYGRTQNFASPDEMAPGRPHKYATPDRQPLNHCALAGSS